MKKWFVLMSVLLIVGFLAMIFTRGRSADVKVMESAGVVSPIQNKVDGHAAKDRSNDSYKRDQYNEERRNQIFGAFRRSADLNDGEAFRKELSRLFSKEFKGDPGRVLAELEPYLNHSDKRIRFELAKACIWAGIHNDKVIQTLFQFVSDKSNVSVEKLLPGHSGEKYVEDFRKEAAMLLVNYRINGIANPLWDAYQQTSDPIYLRYLAVFKDARVADEARSLITLKKAKYIDLHEILGAYKVQEAAKPLEAVFMARQERNPKTNQSELAWSIYQITKKQEYYDYLIRRKSYLNNTFLEVPDVLQILSTTLREGNGPGLDHERRIAFLSLLSRHDGRKVVEDYLVEVFDEKIKSALDATLGYHIAAHLDSERLNLAVQRYEEKYGDGLWLHYSKRRGWPINDLIVGYKY